MLLESFVGETAAIDLAKKLPSLAKHDYDTIDRLMQKVAAKHRITGKLLHDLFVKKYRSTPDDWIKNKLDENNVECDLEKEVEKFFHELVHVRQSELNMIKPGDSYPGSPIEVMADMLAGKYIKIYGAKNNHIFQ
jgi:hypothetical protein